MIRDQFNALLTRIQVLDNRQVDRMTAEAWWPLIGALDYQDAVTALETHFREYPDVYLKPGHLVQGVRRIRNDRAMIHDHSPDNRGNAPRPANFDALSAAYKDPAAWRREVAAFNKQLTDSGMTNYVLDLDASERTRQTVAAGEARPT